MLFNKDQRSKIKKLHDSVKDSDALAKLAYEFGQIANYFDRANSPRSRNFLAQEDEVKYNEFLRKGIQVKAQLQREIEGLTKGMKAGQEIGYFRSYDNKTLGLLIDAISRLSWTSGEMRDNTGKKLAKELEDLYDKYKDLVVNGKRRFDSKTKDTDWDKLFKENGDDVAYSYETGGYKVPLMYRGGPEEAYDIMRDLGIKDPKKEDLKAFNVSYKKWAKEYRSKSRDSKINDYTDQAIIQYLQKAISTIKAKDYTSTRVFLQLILNDLANR